MIRQPVSQPVLRNGECGQRDVIWLGSRLLPYAAYCTSQEATEPRGAERPPRAVEECARVTRVVIIGGGPGGYEAALVGSQLGGEVTLVDTDGLGGSAVLTDCVPSKTLIATAEVMTEVAESGELGIRFGARSDADAETVLHVDLAAVNQRVLDLADRQSGDIARRVPRPGRRRSSRAAAGSTARSGWSPRPRTASRSWTRT